MLLTINFANDKIILGDIMIIKKDLCYGNLKEQKLDIYLPNKENFTTIIYFHGGGIEGGDKAFESFIAPPIVKEGYAFVSVNYRMFPSAKFPEFIEDAALSVKYVKENISGNGKIFITGHSAGAYLSLMLCLNKKYLLANGLNGEDITGYFIDSAQTTTHYNVLKFRGEDSRLERIDEGAPLFFVDENTKFNSMALVFYNDDMPSRYEQNMLFYKTILKFNPNADITYKVLEGKHCADLYKKTGEESCLYVDLLLEYIKAKE